LIIDQFERKGEDERRKRKYARLLIMGDSTSLHTYFAIMFSIRRTLNARVLESSSQDLNALQFNVGQSTFSNSPLFYNNLIELESPSRRLRKIRLSFLRIARDTYLGEGDPMNHFIFKTVCGIPFTGVDSNHNKIDIMGKGDIDVISSTLVFVIMKMRNKNI
jgi:hypothetical protein